MSIRSNVSIMVRTADLNNLDKIKHGSLKQHFVITTEH